MANPATESAVDKIDQTIGESFAQKATRWLFSAGGITICLTILIAIVASIDKGPYVLVNTIITGGMWALDGHWPFIALQCDEHRRLCAWRIFHGRFVNRLLCDAADRQIHACAPGFLYGLCGPPDRYPGRDIDVCDSGDYHRAAGVQTVAAAQSRGMVIELLFDHHRSLHYYAE